LVFLFPSFHVFYILVDWFFDTFRQPLFAIIGDSKPTTIIDHPFQLLYSEVIVLYNSVYLLLMPVHQFHLVFIKHLQILFDFISFIPIITIPATVLHLFRLIIIIVQIPYQFVITYHASIKRCVLVPVSKITFIQYIGFVITLYLTAILDIPMDPAILLMTAIPEWIIHSIRNIIDIHVCSILQHLFTILLMLLLSPINIIISDILFF